MSYFGVECFLHFKPDVVCEDGRLKQVSIQILGKFCSLRSVCLDFTVLNSGGG
jgi:hypothetical protein